MTTVEVCSSFIGIYYHSPVFRRHWKYKTWCIGRLQKDILWYYDTLILCSCNLISLKLVTTLAHVSGPSPTKTNNYTWHVIKWHQMEKECKYKQWFYCLSFFSISNSISVIHCSLPIRCKSLMPTLMAHIRNTSSFRLYVYSNLSQPAFSLPVKVKSFVPYLRAPVMALQY